MMVTMVNFPPSDYISGEITLTENDVEFTGTGTGWLAMMFRPGDLILDIEDAPEYVVVIEEITSNTSGTLTRPWPGPTVTCGYRMRYQWDAGRVTAMSAALREELGNGNIQALAGLTGIAGGVPVFTGPGAMEIRPVTDFVTGVAYDVQVDTIAERAVYDDQPTGFSVLVGDIGDGRAAIYSKASATSGDWSAPAFVTGPQGAMPVLEVGDTTTGGPGTDADVAISPIAGGYELEFTIPAGEGFYAQGSYDSGATYNNGDVVLYNGSSFVAKVETTGNAPPTLPTTENTWWVLIARAGIDGAGTVTTIAAGVGIDVDLTDPTAPEVGLADVPSATIKGRVAAGSGPPTDLTVGEVVTLLGVPAKADQTTAEAGTDNDDYMTALRVKQAIDALTTPFDPSELYTNVSLLALNAAGFEGTVLGFSGMIADAFEDESGVQLPVYGGIDDYAKAALHFDGTQGSSTIVDSASPGLSWTVAGDAQLSTAQAKFGTASLETTGDSGTLVSTPDNAALALGTADFTIDFWVNWKTAPASAVEYRIWYPQAPSGARLYITVYQNALSIGVTGSNQAVSAALTWTLDQWYHIAVVRSGSTLTVFRDGAQVATGNIGTFNYVSGSAWGIGDNCDAYFDEFRLSVGIARWTAPFTPPVAAYAGLITPGSENQVYDAVNGLYRPASGQNMTLVSVGYPSQVQPDKARLVLQIDTPLAVVPGVDFSGEVSRDGINWVEAEDLALVASIGTIKTYASGAIDLSGEPAGVDMHWRLKTLTNEDIAMTGVVENWG